MAEQQKPATLLSAELVEKPTTNQQRKANAERKTQPSASSAGRR